MQTITVNGEPRAHVDGQSLEQLIAALGLTGKRIAIERNGEIVPRSRHAAALLQPGDRIELVVAVGGG